MTTTKTTEPESEPEPEPLSELEEVIQNQNPIKEIQQLSKSTNVTWSRSTLARNIYSYPNANPYTNATLPIICQSVLTPIQLTYLSTQIHQSIPSLINSNRTLFIHPNPYSTSTGESTPPELYQDLLTTCALYTQKTPQNQNTVFNILDYKVESLKERARNISPWDVEEMLLILQALIMYQVIRIFDGDKTQRLKARLDFQFLGILTGRLRRSYTEAELNCFVRTPYQQWVLLESIRRTIMMAVFLRGTWCAIENGYCDIVPLLNILPVSFDGRLWGLEEAAWEEVMNEMSTVGSGLGTYLDFVASWSRGGIECERVKDYEMMLLVGCRESVALSRSASP